MNRRLIRTTIAAASVAGMAAFASAAPAMASDNANGTTIYANNAFCGGAFDKTQPVEGFINFHQAGTDLQVIVHLKDAKPDTTYSLFQYGGFCTFQNTLPQVTTNSNGVANETVDVTVPAGQTAAFVFGFGDGQTIESLSANTG